MRGVGGLITLKGGILLAICFFLPAVPGCDNKPIYPHEVPMAWPAYILGLLAAVLVVLFWKRLDGAREIVRWIFFGGAILSALALGYMLVAMAAETLREETPSWPKLRVLFCLLWLAGFAAMGWGLAFRKNVEAFAGRTTATTGALLIIWFVQFLSEGALYGLYLSIFASVMLLVGGVLVEIRAGEPPGIGPEPSPRS